MPLFLKSFPNILMPYAVECFTPRSPSMLYLKNIKRTQDCINVKKCIFYVFIFIYPQSNLIYYICYLHNKMSYFSIKVRNRRHFVTDYRYTWITYLLFFSLKLLNNQIEKVTKDDFTACNKHSYSPTYSNFGSNNNKNYNVI